MNALIFNQQPYLINSLGGAIGLIMRLMLAIGIMISKVPLNSPWFLSPCPS
ncbi:MAG: hypothetical protein HC781_20965 [Leptolyngbyaceae cyanobacterium CSU_1_4]|nr:hypothetical protein [Leptolyngbyaceae cyanobacterium CSU_1_4]